MPRGAPSPKLSITIDPVVHERLIEAAEADGLSVSAWITRAVDSALGIRGGLAAVAEYEAEHGAFTDEELAAARARVAEEIRVGGEWGRE